MQRPRFRMQVFQQGQLNLHGVVGVSILPKRTAVAEHLEQLHIRLQNPQGGLIALLEGCQQTGMRRQMPAHQRLVVSALAWPRLAAYGYPLP